MSIIDLPPTEFRRVYKREKRPSRWARVRWWLWEVKPVIAAIAVFLGWLALCDFNETAGNLTGSVIIAAITIALVVRFPWIWAILMAFGIGSE